MSVQVTKVDDFTYQIVKGDAYYVLQAYNKHLNPYLYLVELSCLDVKDGVVLSVTQEYEVEVYDATRSLINAIMEDVLTILKAGDLGQLVPLCLNVGGKVRGFKPVSAPVDVLKFS